MYDKEPASYTRVRVWLGANRTFIYLYIVFTVVVFLSALRLSGTSVGVFNQHITGNIKSEDVIFGTPRLIRGDEWIIQTPLLLSQTQNGLMQVNPDIGLGENTAVLFDAPNKHWSTFFKPHNWSFFVLPVEYAFAFKWWFRAGILLTVSYLLLLLLTGYNYFLSIAGSLVFLFSPFVQWWYAIDVMGSLDYGLLTAYFTIRILRYENKKRLFIYWGALVYSMVAFSLSLNPPYQVSSAYLSGALILGYFLEHKRMIARENFGSKILSICLGILVVAGILIGYYFSQKETIMTIMNTSYPGKRVVTGGTYSLIRFLSSSYNFLLQLNGGVPPLLRNQTEASSFTTIILFMLFLPVVFYQNILNLLKRNKLNYLLISLSAYFLIGLIWLFIGFHPVLAKYSLFYLIPENRMMIGMGGASIFLVIIFLNHFDLKSLRWFKFSSQWFAIGYSLLSFAVLFFIGRKLLIHLPAYIRNNSVIIFVSLVLSATLYVTLTQRKKTAMCFIAGFSIISSIFVNPLYRGLSPLRNSDLSKELVEFNRAENKGNARWLAYNSFIWGDFLIAQGFAVLNGTHLYPQFEIWERFDPSKVDREKYNRYEHIVFEDTDSDQVVISNPWPDTTKMSIRPCNPNIKGLNVKYIVSDKDLSIYPCLITKKEIKLNGSSKLRIYEIK